MRLGFFILSAVLSFTVITEAKYRPKVLLSNHEFRALSAQQKLRYSILLANAYGMMRGEGAVAPSFSSLLWSMAIEPAYCAVPTGSCIVCGFVSQFNAKGRCTPKKEFTFEGKTIRCAKEGQVLCNPAIFGTQGDDGACIKPKGSDYTAQANEQFLESCKAPKTDMDKTRCAELPNQLMKYRTDAELREMDKMFKENCTDAIKQNYDEDEVKKWETSVKDQSELGEALALSKGQPEVSAVKTPEDQAKTEALLKDEQIVEQHKANLKSPERIAASRRIIKAKKEDLDKRMKDMSCGWNRIGVGRSTECDRLRILELEKRVLSMEEGVLNAYSPEYPMLTPAAAIKSRDAAAKELAQMKKNLGETTREAYVAAKKKQAKEDKAPAKDPGMLDLAQEAISAKPFRIPAADGPKKPKVKKNRLADFASTCIQLQKSFRNNVSIIGSQQEQEAAQ